MRARIAAAAIVALLVTFLVTATSPSRLRAEDRWIEWQVLGLINHTRAGAGLPALSMSRDLQGMARGWSDHMAWHNYVAHNPNAWNGISAAAPQWRAMGENVGAGWSVGEIHNALMASPSHRGQILGRYNYVGIGATVRGGRIYLTQDFVLNNGWLAASAVPDFSQASDGDLIRNPANGGVYLVQGGAKFWVRDEATFWHAGYSWSSVRDLSPWVVDAVPNVPREGALLAQVGDARVYVIRGGAKALIPDAATFERAGYHWDWIRYVPPGSLDGIREVPYW